MTTSPGQPQPPNPPPPTTASKKHLQIVQDAETTVTSALQQIAIDKDLLTTEAWDEFSTHVTTFMRDLYSLSLKNKHELDSNISRSCVNRAHSTLVGRRLFPNLVGAIGGALLGAGISLILGVATATVADSIAVRTWATISALAGIAMLAYQFHKKS